jgi:hypothetical protein
MDTTNIGEVKKFSKGTPDAVLIKHRHALQGDAWIGKVGGSYLHAMRLDDRNALPDGAGNHNTIYIGRSLTEVLRVMLGETGKRQWAEPPQRVPAPVIRALAELGYTVEANKGHGRLVPTQPIATGAGGSPKSSSTRSSGRRNGGIQKRK